MHVDTSDCNLSRLRLCKRYTNRYECASGRQRLNLASCPNHDNDDEPIVAERSCQTANSSQARPSFQARPMVPRPVHMYIDAGMLGYVSCDVRLAEGACAYGHDPNLGLERDAVVEPFDQSSTTISSAHPTPSPPRCQAPSQNNHESRLVYRLSPTDEDTLAVDTDEQRPRTLHATVIGLRLVSVHTLHMYNANPGSPGCMPCNLVLHSRLRLRRRADKACLGTCCTKYNYVCTDVRRRPPNEHCRDPRTYEEYAL